MEREYDSLEYALPCPALESSVNKHLRDRTANGWTLEHVSEGQYAATDGTVSKIISLYWVTGG